MLIPLNEATPEVAGGKAGALGALVRGGFAVPPGFASPRPAYRAHSEYLDLPGVAARHGVDQARHLVEARPLSDELLDQIDDALRELGDRPVAVRSSGAAEDSGGASAAGQYGANSEFRGSTRSRIPCGVAGARFGHPERSRTEEPAASRNDDMGVVIQRQVDAEVAGVMVTAPSAASATTIEASWGLGETVVQGRVTPDSYVASSDDSVRRSVGDKVIRVDREDGRLVSRPITARLRDGRRAPHVPGSPLFDGTPASAGTATGSARVVRGPEDFDRVMSGDILVCETTDPGWTPLLDLAAGVLTQTGGLLCHAAIVARERSIPAVVGIDGLLDALTDGAVVTVDGRSGTVALTPSSP